MTMSINHLLFLCLWNVSAEVKWRTLNRHCKLPTLKETDIVGTMVWANEWVPIPKENTKQVAIRHRKQLKCTLSGQWQYQTFSLQWKYLIQMQAAWHILQRTNMYLRSIKMCQQLICFLLQGCFFPYIHSIVRGNTSYLLQQERERDKEKEDRVNVKGELWFV